MSEKPSSLGGVLIVLVPLIAIAAYLAMSYNGILSSEEEVFTAWAQVESNYQRRADLIPSLIKTVKAYADHERSVIIDATDARVKGLQALTESAQALSHSTEEANKTTLGSKDKLSDEAHMTEINSHQKDVKDHLTAFVMMAEAYPNLKAGDNFMALQDQIEGTENRINVSRLAFNEKAGEFNAAIRRIPGNLMAGLGGFKRKAYFQADAGASKAVIPDFK
jgi:LemA protein